jgi:hypothetical protein
VKYRRRKGRWVTFDTLLLLRRCWQRLQKHTAGVVQSRLHVQLPTSGNEPQLRQPAMVSQASAGLLDAWLSLDTWP